MCGLVGYVGHRPAVEILLKGLKRLEYRGYDSAGVAFFMNGKIQLKKSEGKLENVEKLLNASEPPYSSATCGIGHTRWATHGKPTTQNAHPHRTGHIVLVHNGIIENYQDLKKEIITWGKTPQSETDSELFGFLVEREVQGGASFVDAVRKSFTRLEGGCSVVVMSENDPGVIVGVRNGSPLVAAIDPQGGAVLASDAQPLLDITQEVFFLEHGDVVVGTEKGIEFFDLKTGAKVQRAMTKIDWSVEKLDKQGFAHYMLKEIHEQPTALVDTLNSILDRAKTDPFPLALQPAVGILDKAEQIMLVACGTSWHAALLGKFWLENWARIPTHVELASEFRYRNPVIMPGTVVIGVTQSGETADTLAVLKQMRELGVPTLGVTNVRNSTVSREADAVLYTSAGPEIGVAATKTFSTQMLVMLLAAGYLAIKRSASSNKEVTKLFHDLVKLPMLLSQNLEEGGAWMQVIRKAAQNLYKSKGFFFIGRGYSFPLALEGALKLKEIAYVHAEGYAAGELKHGPIAMIDNEMAVIVIAPCDRWRDKTISNLEEVKARGAIIVGVGEEGDEKFRSLCNHWIPLPHASDLHESLLPFLVAPIVQLLSYELAVLKGTDVDKPRNLAKSVTVE